MSEDDARRRDAEDPGHRALFLVPPAQGGRYQECAYFAGNSLGLQPRAAKEALLGDLDDWATLAVEGHVEARRPWTAYHSLLTGPAARLVGALPEETVVMNTLTVNLHLLMVSFYRPRGERTRILVEESAFPSDSYAVRSQARYHGLDPDVEVIRTADPLGHLAAEGDKVALVLLGGVNYLTGEVLDIPGITRAGHAAGAKVGWDLAHAAGNIPLELHEWGPDFAAWCSYKYLNSGPGALGGVFVHQRHLDDPSIQRFEGWWSTEPETRFLMEPIATPPKSADAWQISNPPIFAMSPIRVSLELFDSIGMPALRARSLRLTAYLEGLLGEHTVVTPREPERRGCQLSLRVPDADGLSRRLSRKHGVIADSRNPDILRLAPTPLYSTYHDCWRAAEALRAEL
ncbi:kynureninase [Nonomuraea zeae]|uniref:Kynureninase n=1 Tax=Nonomuraea zeae TaxID=1642303 RepID=A0A5S4GWL5_9ACTN|nr:kynureninase [Nonomuraea zeae]TMR37169.1 kynureninase [Nonomuraea zeae]